MALESGRVGVRKDQVDTYGRVAIAEDMAEHWIATKMYTAGEFVLYKNDYYKALFDNVGSAPDLFQDWELTKIGNEVSSLYDDIAKLKTWELITKQGVNGTNTSYPISDISKYTDICIVALINVSIRGAIEIPNSVFMKGIDIYITCNNGSNAYTTTYIKKNADNTFSCTGGGQVNYIHIYGR